MLAILTVAIPATLVTYPAPSATFPSGPFNISVTEGAGTPQTSFVYHSASPSNGPGAQKGKSMSWSTFSFAGTVSVAVTPQKNWTNVVLRPTSLGLTASRVGDAAVFSLAQQTKVIVEFDGDTKDSLIVFGDDLEEHLPLREGDIEFGPGVHDINQSFTVPKGARVHLAGGAWVRGTLASKAAAHGATIEGRGVLSGELLAHPSSATDALAMLNLCGNDITVRGLTIVNPPTYMVNLNPYWKGCIEQRSLVENVKAMGWHYTSDGIMVGRNSIVQDCYVRANDDSLKLYMSHTRWERNLIWQLDNGWPLMLSWNTMSNEHNISVTDTVVVHVEHTGDTHGARAVVGAVHGGTAHLSNYRFENLVVEGPVFRPFGITVQKTQFGPFDTGTISDLTFRNFAFEGAAKSDSKLDGNVSQIAFYNLSLEGTVVSSAQEGHFQLGEAVTDVTFSPAAIGD